MIRMGRLSISCKARIYIIVGLFVFGLANFAYSGAKISRLLDFLANGKNYRIRAEAAYSLGNFAVPDARAVPLWGPHPCRRGCPTGVTDRATSGA